MKTWMAQFLPRSQCVFMPFRPVAQHWKRWATLPLALWKLSCRSTPISPLSAERGARRLVFPAQSSSKLWPSLCALGTRPTAIPILSIAFPTQSRTVPSPPAPPPQTPTGYQPKDILFSLPWDMGTFQHPETSQLLYVWPRATGKLLIWR